MEDIAPHLPRLRRYARALTGDRVLADDLVQDTAERALAKFGLWRKTGRFESWLLTIMHNVFANQIKSRTSRPPESLLDDLAVEPAVRARQSDYLEIGDLDDALKRLPPEQREVLLLVTLEELSYEDTARILDIPVGTVMSRLSRARDRLHQLLDASVANATLKVVK